MYNCACEKVRKSLRPKNGEGLKNRVVSMRNDMGYPGMLGIWKWMGEYPGPGL